MGGEGEAERHASAAHRLSGCNDRKRVTMARSFCKGGGALPMPFIFSAAFPKAPRSVDALRRKLQRRVGARCTTNRTHRMPRGSPTRHLAHGISCAHTEAPASTAWWASVPGPAPACTAMLGIRARAGMQRGRGRRFIAGCCGCHWRTRRFATNARGWPHRRHRAADCHLRWA